MRYFMCGDVRVGCDDLLLGTQGVIFLELEIAQRS